MAILACFLPYLNETITWYNAVGIVCATVAVLCFMSNPGDRKHASVAKRAVTLGLFMVITASFLRAGQGLSSKYATVFEADIGGVMLVNAVFWIVGGLLYALLRERNLMKMDSPMIGYGVMSGGIVFGIIFFMLESTKGGNAAVVLPLQQMSFPVTLLLSVIFLHEKVTRAKLAGIVCSIAAVILLCLD